MFVLQQPEHRERARDDEQLAARREPDAPRDALQVAPRHGGRERDIFDRLKAPRRREERMNRPHDRRRQLAELSLDGREEALGECIHGHAHGERTRGARLIFDAGDQQSSGAARQELGGEGNARRGERRVKQDRDGGVAREQRRERARAVLEAAISRVEDDEIDVTALECGCDALVVVDARGGDDGFIGAECGAQASEEEVGEEGDDDHESCGVRATRGRGCLIRALTGRGRAQLTTGVSANVAASLHDDAPRLETGRWSDAAHTGRFHASSSHTHPLVCRGGGCRVHITNGAAADGAR